MSKLKAEEIDYIMETYKKLKSIEKTAEATGFCKNAVNSYVKDISSKDKRSRDCLNPVLQIDINTNKVIKEWNKPSMACKSLGISNSEVCRVLKGELSQAGGFGWRYKENK